VPNRRRRKLSTAMSAFAALAVASPVAVVATSGLATETKPAPQHREFVQAAMITDLPSELMSALSQGLSQFGINLPPLPTGLLTGSGATTAPSLTTPGLTSPGLTTPGVSVPALTDPALANPALTNPALTSPIGETPGGLTTPGVPPAPGLTTPPTGVDPALTSPISNTTGLPTPSEMPISAPIADPALGTYPILGDPMLAAPPAPASGGLLGDLSSAAQQLGAGQAIDLLKGVAMPAIMQAIKSAAPPPAAPPAPAPAPPA
jgi:hypothetical protein